MLEPEGMRRDPKKDAQEGEAPPGGYGGGVGAQGVAYGIRLANTTGNGIGVREESTPTLTTRGPEAVAYLLRIRGGKEGGGKGALLQADRSGTLATSNDQTLFTVDSDGWCIRHLTPVEFERLQGFPDGYTDIPYNGKDHPPDAPRYKALGNSMAVPVMRWIGERIEMCEFASRYGTACDRARDRSN